jgi:hypothetical protein
VVVSCFEIQRVKYRQTDEQIQTNKQTETNKTKQTSKQANKHTSDENERNLLLALVNKIKYVHGSLLTCFIINSLCVVGANVASVNAASVNVIVNIPDSIARIAR